MKYKIFAVLAVTLSFFSHATPTKVSLTCSSYCDAKQVIGSYIANNSSSITNGVIFELNMGNGLRHHLTKAEYDLVYEGKILESQALEDELCSGQLQPDTLF